LAVVITGDAAAAGAATDETAAAAAGAATAAAGAGELLFLLELSARTAGAGAVTAEEAAGAGAASSSPVAPLVPELPAGVEDGTASSETLDRFWRGEGFSAVTDPRLPRPAAGAGSSPSALLLFEDEPASRPPRSPRAGRDVPDFDALEDEEALDASELEPDDPVVSAYAIGIAAIPVPMPRATASAPMRPMWRA
jgi:hypothetical protein